jgi:peroxiredoxin
VSESAGDATTETAATAHDARLAAMTFPNALRSNDRAPDFRLPNARGETVQLASLLEHGPVVLVFYRGGWCPFCNTQLRALRDVHDQIKELGATLVAVSPQRPDSSAAFADEAGLDFDVLSDVGGYVAADYGIRFELSTDERELFLSVGNDLRKVNGSDAWLLVAPSTYVIARDGVIEYARTDSDHTTRPDVQEVMSVLAAVTPR